MANRVVAFAYSRARLQARYGQRPTPAEWEQLETIADFGRFVQAVRDTSLRRWALHFDSGIDPHRIELHLREEFRALVAEVAAWQPDGWSGFIHWLAWLPDLPVAAHRLHDGEMLPWMAQDPVYASLQPGTAPADTGFPAWQALLREWRPQTDLAALWFGSWRRLRPVRDARRYPGLVRVERAVGDALRQLQAWAGEGRNSGEPARRALGERLALVFRRHTQESAAAVAYLALAWLDMRRLRGGLLRRLLLAGSG